MHTFARRLHGSHRSHGATPVGATSDTTVTRGLILTGGWRYDLHGWFLDTCLFRGMGRALRRRTLAIARLRPGEQILDVGCGTGTLALNALRQVGATGRVVGIDPGAEQIARARAKAARRHASQGAIEFQVGVIERLPFPDQTFDVALSTLMMHHLPAPLKRQGLVEIARALKPGGRLVIADFTRRQGRQGLARRFHAGGSDLQDMVALVEEAGFVDVETEDVRPPRFSAFPGASMLVAYKR